MEYGDIRWMIIALLSLEDDLCDSFYLKNDILTEPKPTFYKDPHDS